MQQPELQCQKDRKHGEAIVNVVMEKESLGQMLANSSNTFKCENCEEEGEFQLKCALEMCNQKVCKDCCPFLPPYYCDDALLGECLACYKFRKGR